MHRAHKIKLDPTKEQEVYFTKACGVARFAYNWALAAWIEEYEKGNKPNHMAISKLLNSIKAIEFPWMSEVTKCAPQNAIKNVGAAFDNFFRRSKQGVKPGYPRFKRKGVRDSFRADNGPKSISSSAVKCLGKAVTLPRCGIVRMREQLRFSGRVLRATVSRMADGWYVTLLVDTNDCLSGPLGGGTVGVDLGIKEFATLSNGVVVPSLRPHREAHARLARLSRSLSRKQKGSSNRAKAKTKLAKLHLHISRVRVDALHKLTTHLATEFDTIAIEDLNVKGMLMNRHLARSIADAGFSEFRRQLVYKAAMTGARVHVVERFFPSSKICHSCGGLHPMKLNQRRMVCGCGVVIDRDLNAAINLKDHAESYSVSACGEESSGFGRKALTKLSSVKQEVDSEQ